MGRTKALLQFDEIGQNPEPQVQCSDPRILNTKGTGVKNVGAVRNGNQQTLQPAAHAVFHRKEKSFESASDTKITIR